MKMPEKVFNDHYADIRAVLQEVANTGLKVWPGNTEIDFDNLQMRDIWNVHHRVLIDRGNSDHPVYEVEGILPRVLDFKDQSPYFLYNDYDLDDEHIQTAFKAMLKKISEDPITPAVGPSPI